MGENRQLERDGKREKAEEKEQTVGVMGFPHTACYVGNTSKSIFLKLTENKNAVWHSLKCFTPLSFSCLTPQAKY